MKKILFALFKTSYAFLAKTPLRKIPGMLELSNVIFRALWPQGNIVEIQGNKMYINVRDPNPTLRKTFQAYGMNLVHEETTTKIFKQIIRPGDVVLDLGANIGYFTALAASTVGKSGKVFSFEPEPTNFSYLKETVKANGFQNVYLNQKAVSDKNGSTQLFICTYDTGHHTINQFGGIVAAAKGRHYEKKAIDIETVRIDDYLKNKTNRVNVIKMDVEGAEALALEGMRETLQKNNVKMFLEFFPILIKEMGSDATKYIESLLNDFGFRMYGIGHDYDLEKAEADLNPVTSYDQLVGMLEHENDHLNLYLAKES